MTARRKFVRRRQASVKKGTAKLMKAQFEARVSQQEEQQIRMQVFREAYLGRIKQRDSEVRAVSEDVGLRVGEPEKPESE